MVRQQEATELPPVAEGAGSSCRSPLAAERAVLAPCGEAPQLPTFSIFASNRPWEVLANDAESVVVSDVETESDGDTDEPEMPQQGNNTAATAKKVLAESPWTLLERQQ